MWTEFDDCFRSFYDAYMENQRKYGNNHGVLAQPDRLPPPNAYTVSCVPWIAFDHFAVHSYENKPYFFPSVEAGRFSNENGRIMMPLSSPATPPRPTDTTSSAFLKLCKRKRTHLKNTWICKQDAEKHAAGVLPARHSGLNANGGDSRQKPVRASSARTGF